MLAIIAVACTGVTKTSARITVACTSSASVSKNSAGLEASAGVAANNVSNSVFIVILSRCRFWGRAVLILLLQRLCLWCHTAHNKLVLTFRLGMLYRCVHRNTGSVLRRCRQGYHRCGCDCYRNLRGWDNNRCRGWHRRWLCLHNDCLLAA